MRATPQAIMHRGEITKMARECELYPDHVVVKYGVAGRVLLGPKGHPGLVTLPVSIKVADADHKVLANDAAKRDDHDPAGQSGRLFLRGQGDQLPDHDGHAA